MKNFCLFFLIAMVIVSGCGGEDVETGSMLGEKISSSTDLVAAGELRKVAGEVVPGAPALERPKKTEITYWRDLEFTEEVKWGDSLPVGTTIYTKVVFPRDVPIVYGDDKEARPKMYAMLGGGTRYQIKPKSTPDADLQSGEAKPWGGTDHIFLCRFDIPADPGLVGYSYNVVVLAGREGQVDGKLISLTPPSLNTESGDFTYVSGDKGHSTDLTGQVVVLARDHLDWAPNPRSLVQAVPGAMVTIVSGPRAGEETFTDGNGYYRFPKVRGNKLHLRVEKEFLEPKEVIVRRSGPTTLPDGFSPAKYYEDDPQRHPGVILMGLRWPDKVRPIFEETTVEPDLLLALQVAVRGSPGGRRGLSGMYRSGVVLIDEACWYNTITFMLAYSYLEAMTRKAGKDWTEWEELPMVRSFISARRKDLREHGGSWIDRDCSSHSQNFSRAFAAWWFQYKGIDPSHPRGNLGKAPNRLRWMENHTWK